MARSVNNTRKCIDCDAPVPRKVKRCVPCGKEFLKNRGATYIRTPEHNSLMSAVTKGMKKKHKSASTNPIVAEKIRNWWTPEKREAARLRGITFSLDPMWREKIALSVSKEKNPMWEDGRAVLPYTPGFGRKVKQLAWERANYKCEICGSDNPHDTHHKDFSKTNHELNNLQVLCRKCHKALHVQHLKEKRAEKSTIR